MDAETHLINYEKLVLLSSCSANQRTFLLNMLVVSVLAEVQPDKLFPTQAVGAMSQEPWAAANPSPPGSLPDPLQGAITNWRQQERA